MFLILFPLCFMAGLIQTVTGFGSGVVIMLVLPLLMPLIEASTISNSITLFLCTSLAWQYRKTINLSKRMFFAHRVKNVVINECSTDEKERYIEHNPKYGRIICRCEQVSEGEIIDCIRRKCGARSIVAVKKRVRPGMGKCQGGFCEPLVVKILAKELGISPSEVDYNEKGSPVLVCESKGVHHEKG